MEVNIGGACAGWRGTVAPLACAGNTHVNSVLWVGLIGASAAFHASAEGFPPSQLR
jgi:hypothetical protein